jgi:hypothetical protein
MAVEDYKKTLLVSGEAVGERKTDPSQKRMWNSDTDKSACSVILIFVWTLLSTRIESTLHFEKDDAHEDSCQ